MNEQEEQIEVLRSLWNQRAHFPLFGEFNYAVLTAEELKPAFTAFHELLWGHHQPCNIDLALDEAELAASPRLAERLENAFHLYLGIFERDRLIGWSWGRQESSDEYHMVVTALFPEYRGLGIYTGLLPEIFRRVQAEGFQIVYSWHYPDSPEVLVPKLKAGFVIGGFRLWDQFGLLVQLIYPFNPKRRELFGYRVGRGRISDRIAPVMRDLD